MGETSDSEAQLTFQEFLSLHRKNFLFMIQLTITSPSIFVAFPSRPLVTALFFAPRILFVNISWEHTETSARCTWFCHLELIPNLLPFSIVLFFQVLKPSWLLKFAFICNLHFPWMPFYFPLLITSGSLP